MSVFIIATIAAFLVTLCVMALFMRRQRRMIDNLVRSQDTANTAAEKMRRNMELIADRTDERETRMREVINVHSHKLEHIEKKLDDLNAAITPDDSLARIAKEQVDKFNAGIFNILTYNGAPKDGETK